jgi:transposase
MVVISESVHPRSLSFANQRKVVALRDKGWSFPDIANEVVNLAGKHPPTSTLSDLCKTFSNRRGSKPFKYKKCGRKPWKLPKETQRFIISRLRELRKTGVCTSVTLQKILVKEKGIEVEVSAIQKILKANGYKWLPRSQKRRYDKPAMKIRKLWAQEVADMTPAQVKAKLCMSLDGVVLSMPPADLTGRLNYCSSGVSKMWRKPSESNSPDLAGDDPYVHQLPLDRAVPLWGGISANGFSAVLFHRTKKLTTDEWVTAVTAGKLKDAVAKLNQHKPNGPWMVLCDGEKFLHANASKAAYKKHKITMWKVPARSPDLNPVEKYWSWLRRRLMALDFKDLRAKRRPLSKMAYTQRVRGVISTVASTRAAGNIANAFRKNCIEVALRKGAAARN